MQPGVPDPVVLGHHNGAFHPVGNDPPRHQRLLLRPLARPIVQDVVVYPWKPGEEAPATMERPWRSRRTVAWQRPPPPASPERATTPPARLTSCSPRMNPHIMDAKSGCPPSRPVWLVEAAACAAGSAAVAKPRAAFTAIRHAMARRRRREPLRIPTAMPFPQKRMARIDDKRLSIALQRDTGAPASDATAACAPRGERRAWHNNLAHPPVGSQSGTHSGTGD